MAITKKTLGSYVQLGGVAAFAVGAILSMHHLAIGAVFVGGALAYYLGEKIGAMTS